jgi:transposase InsO family protein
MNKDEFLKGLFNNPKIGLTNMESLWKNIKEFAKEDPEIAAMNITRKDVGKFYKNYEPLQVNKPVEKLAENHELQIVAEKPKHIFQADLIDLSKYSAYNYKYQYLLQVIDVHSRRAWSIPLKNKESGTVRSAFEDLFQKHKPQELTTDQGSEFTNKTIEQLMRDQNIKHLTAQVRDHNRMGLVERYNKTIRMKLSRLFAINRDHNWYDYIKDIVHGYNHTVHRTVQEKPIDIYEDRKKSRQKIRKRPTFNVKVGDKVRVLLNLNEFEKGTLPRWSQKLYTVEARIINKFRTSKGDHLYRPNELLVVKPDTLIKTAEDDDEEDLLTAERKINNRKKVARALRNLEINMRY